MRNIAVPALFFAAITGLGIYWGCGNPGYALAAIAFTFSVYQG